MATIEEALPHYTILHRYEGDNSRPDSITFGESTKYPGGKIYFNALKPEDYPDILENFKLMYSMLMVEMRSLREKYPPLVAEKGGKANV